jgi:hypothetical protein
MGVVRIEEKTLYPLGLRRLNKLRFLDSAQETISRNLRGEMSKPFQHLRHQAPIAALDGRDAALGKPNELIPQRVPAHFRDTYPRFNVFLPENEVAARPFKVFQYQTHIDLARCSRQYDNVQKTK